MKRNCFLNKIRKNTPLKTNKIIQSYAESQIKKHYMKSIFTEIKTDYIDDNGVIHIDGYKTDDENEEGTGVGYFINGEAYWRDPEFQFDPKVNEAVIELTKNYKETSKDKENAIKAAVVSVVYDNDAKPRLEFTDGSPLEKKLQIIDEAVIKIKDIFNL